MRKKKSFSRKRNEIEIGAYNKLPHYVVVGKPNDYYVYINKDGYGNSSKRIKGKEAFAKYHELLQIKDKEKLKEELEKLYEANKKDKEGSWL